MNAHDYQPEYGESFARFVRIYRARRALALESRVIRNLHRLSTCPFAVDPEMFGETLFESLWMAACRLAWTFDLELSDLGFADLGYEVEP